MIHIPAAFRSSLCVAFLLASAIAHAGPPHIAGVMPAGGMRGTSTTLQVMGKNLNESTALISGKGVLVESVETGGEGAAVKLKIAQDAPLGPRELRLISKNGASNSARIWIDVFPDGQEAEPNEDSAHAQALTQTPIVMNGRLQAATDRDTFSFQARAEEIWVFDCVAARIRSRLDAVLELRDSAGNILKMAQSTWENDPRLSFKFTEDGPYFITIRDTQFYGGPEFVYRLTAGQLPSVEGYIPRGERAGRPLGMEITGVGLPRPRAVVTIPEDASAGSFWTVVDTARGPSLPIELIVGPYPVTGLTETDATMPLPLLPAYIDGIFTRIPRYRFFFRGTTKDHFHFEVWARRLGSRVDPALRVLNMAGREVGANDDITPTGQLLEARGKDSRLIFKPPADGLYTLEVRNVDDRIGPECFYRIEARRQAPDFAVDLNVDRINVGSGGTAAFTVNVERLGGFQGPIAITARDLPTGVAFKGGTITAERGSIDVTISVPPDQSLGAKEIRIVGEAPIGGKPAYRVGTPRDEYMHRHANPALFGDEPYVKPFRPSEMLLLGVTSRTEPFSLSADSGALRLSPGGKQEITVRAARDQGADGEIKLEFKGLPSKVTAAPSTIPAGKNEVRITLTATADAPAASTNVVVIGKMGSAAQAAPAIPIVVNKQP